MGATKIVTALAAASLAAAPAAARAAETPADAWQGVASHVPNGPVPTRPVGPGERASGAVYIGYRGADGETTGAIATLSPISPAFVRVGAELTPRSLDANARFLWGVGLESPRPRTFFLDVHDWGPVRPGSAFTLRTAEASFGYKLPPLRGGPLTLALTPFAALPFEGGPSAGAEGTLTLRETWFVSGSIGWTPPGVLPGPGEPQRWRASFALGRWNGTPGGLFVTYRDELRSGGVASLKPVHRDGRGVLAAGVNWSY